MGLDHSNCLRCYIRVVKVSEGCLESIIEITQEYIEVSILVTVKPCNLSLNLVKLHFRDKLS